MGFKELSSFSTPSKFSKVSVCAVFFFFPSSFVIIEDFGEVGERGGEHFCLVLKISGFWFFIQLERFEYQCQYIDTINIVQSVDYHALGF